MKEKEEELLSVISAVLLKACSISTLKTKSMGSRRNSKKNFKTRNRSWIKTRNNNKTQQSQEDHSEVNGLVEQLLAAAAGNDEDILELLETVEIVESGLDVCDVSETRPSSESHGLIGKELIDFSAIKPIAVGTGQIQLNPATHATLTNKQVLSACSETAESRLVVSDLSETRLVDSMDVESDEMFTQNFDSLAVQLIPENRATSDYSESLLSLNGLDERDSDLLSSGHVDPCDDSKEEFPSIANWKEVKCMGRRITDFPSWWQQLHEKFAHHSKISLQEECRYLSSLTFHKYFDQGLNTHIYIMCKSCNFAAKTSLAGNEPTIMEINAAAVCGSITSGSGYYNLAEQLAAMGVPPLSHVTYRKKRNVLCDAFRESAEASMRQAGEEERNIAISKGRLTDSGVACIDVIADGTWGKRSYRGGLYDSLGGIAFIIGRETKKVVFASVRNKYCHIHAEAERLGIEPAPHVCFKNWGRDQSSTAMEADIILEGFKSSIEMHGLIYKTLIADEDASTFQSIRDANPYGDHNVLVEKIDCCNHLLRNFCKKIKAASTSNLLAPPEKGTLSKTAFRAFVNRSSLRMRNLIVQVCVIRKTESVPDEEKQSLLQNDIFVIVKHAYGEHSSCDTLPIECKPDVDEPNLIPQLHKTGIFDVIMNAATYLSAHSPSLLKDETTNLAEACNSVFNKYNAGKRVNHTARNSFHMRCWAAVVQHNTQDALSKIHITKGVEIPIAVTKMEESRQRHVENNRLNRHNKVRSKSRRRRGTDKDYGPSAMRPDLPKNMYDGLVKIHLEKLVKRQADRIRIERETIKQSCNDCWHQYRTEMITASKFGDICRSLPTTSCRIKVLNIRYPKVLDTVAIQHGRENEREALQALELKLGKQIMPCGLFIDTQYPYLGASPDGLIDDDGIVEIKCPFTALNMDPEVAVQKVKALKSIFDRKNPELMNKNYKYYYQVQGQLHITGRSYCVFALWTKIGIKHVTVLKDDEFWKKKMLQKLIWFHDECLLPEVIDSRRARNMPIKDPDSIVNAKVEKLKNQENRKRQISHESDDITDDDGEISERPQIRITNDVMYRPTEEIRPAGPWVDINVDEEVEPTDFARIVLDIARQSVTAQQVAAIILSSTTLLDDASIDLFQTVVQENSDFLFHPTSYFGYHTFLQSATATRKDMHIIGGNISRHWCCAYYDGSRIIIYDSLCRPTYDSLYEEEKRYLRKRYPFVEPGNISLQAVTAQPDPYSCGVYAAAFATTIALGDDPAKIKYSRDAQHMRKHMVTLIENRNLMPFPTE